MTPKEKADSLIEAYYNLFAFSNQFTNLNDALLKKTKTAKMAVKGAGMAAQEVFVSVDKMQNDWVMNTSDEEQAASIVLNKEWSFWYDVTQEIAKVWLQLITPNIKYQKAT